MIIHFDSGGGVTGMAGRRACQINTDQLPGDEAAKVISLVKAATVSTTESTSLKPVRPDQVYYEITIQDENQSHTISLSHSIPVAIRPLIDWLNAKALSGH